MQISVTSFSSQVYDKTDETDRVFINSLGEGAIWVCNENGNLDNGDYVCTSSYPGYGMKQDDDILHNYTVAKLTQSLNFSSSDAITLPNGMKAMSDIPVRAKF